MKVTHSLLVLLYIAIGLAFPIQILFTDGTPTIRAGNSVTSQSHEELAAEQQQARAKKFTGDLQTPSTTTDETRQSDAIAAPVSNLGPDGTLLGKFISNDGHPKYALAQSSANSNSTENTTTSLMLTKLIAFLDEHESLCTALGLFALVPIAYLLFLLVELACKSCAQRQSHRPRQIRVRLVGPERQLRASNKRRVIVRGKNRWQTRSTRS